MKPFGICLIILLVVSLAGCHAINDLYEVLGLKRDADEKEIKKAGRKLSAMYHPDRNSDEDSRHKYQHVQRVILSLFGFAESLE